MDRSGAWVKLSVNVLMEKWQNENVNPKNKKLD